VLDVVPFAEDDEFRFVGLLKIHAADPFETASQR
jgi:hypothetical protein